MQLRHLTFPPLAFCILFFMPPNVAEAQIRVDFGAKAGANFGLVGGDMGAFMLSASVAGEDMETSLRTGIAAGGFAVIGSGGAFSIQPELNYVQKGHTVEYTSSPPPSGGLQVSRFGRSERAKMTLKFSYIEIPVLARYQFAPDDKEGIYPHVFAGPTFGFNLASNVDIESDPYNRVNTQNISSQTNDREFGLTVGVGAELDLTGGRAIIDARLGMGFDDIYDSTLDSYRHRSLAVTVGLFF